MNNKIAVFDFDGTITYKDTLPLFIYFSSNFIYLLLKFFIFLPYYIIFKLKFISNNSAKEKLLSLFYKGTSKEQFELFGFNFVEKNLSKYIRHEALDKIKKHQLDGCRVIIISASPEIWVRPFANRLGVECIATKLEFIDNVFTGRFNSPNCYGPEKVKRLKELIGDLNNFYIYGYGDSLGDKELLNISNKPFYRTF
jgi:HAD superfamily hydrolase (TIGR01490 family)